MPSSSQIADPPNTPLEKGMRATVTQPATVLEVALYVAVAFLLAVAAIIGVFRSGAALWTEIAGGATGRPGVMALDQLLLVLMLIEIFHTVCISIRTHHLTVTPFLFVGLIATVRRTLAITMEAAALTDQSHGEMPGQTIVFRNSMIELVLMSFLILVFVFSIIRLRAVSPGTDAESE